PRADELKRLRIGYFEDDGRTPVLPEIRAAVRTAAEALSRAGFDVEPFRPQGLEEARLLWKKFFVKAGGMLVGSMFHASGPEPSQILQQFLSWSAAEPSLSGQDVIDSWIARDLLRASFLEQMRMYPIFLCPPAAIPAFRHGERNWSIEGKTVEYLDAWSYTEWFNLLGNPAAVVPVSLSSEGLPVGVQIVGRPWEEEQLLSVAAALEKQIKGWRKPPIT